MAQDYKSIPCGRAKDREEGTEDPKDQGKASCKSLKLGPYLSMFYYGVSKF